MKAIATGETIANAADARRVLAILADGTMHLDATPDDGVAWEWDTLRNEREVQIRDEHEREGCDFTAEEVDMAVERELPDVYYSLGPEGRTFCWVAKTQYPFVRYVEFTFVGNRCLLKWDSGTDQPSSFIGEVLDAIGVIG
jgi:hypothetical protein|tara:strand:+ start:743 stop:1165 length:423 start_codon:yes stop_codon:yes gene_type:complete